MKSKIFLTAFLIIIALILTFLTTSAIIRPAKFTSVYETRKEINQNRLTVISELQKLYKREKGEYAANIDQLVDFYDKGYSEVTSLKKNVDSIPEGISAQEADKYYDKIITKIPIKEKMNEILKEINLKKDDPIIMKDFQYIPFSPNKDKYKIEIGHQDSLVEKFAVYVPLETMLTNSDQVELKGFIGNIFFKDLVTDELTKDKNRSNKDPQKDARKFFGLQLGDTLSTSVEIIELK